MSAQLDQRLRDTLITYASNAGELLLAEGRYASAQRALTRSMELGCKRMHIYSTAARAFAHENKTLGVIAAIQLGVKKEGTEKNLEELVSIIGRYGVHPLALDSIKQALVSKLDQDNRKAIAYLFQSARDQGARQDFLGMMVSLQVAYHLAESLENFEEVARILLDTKLPADPHHIFNSYLNPLPDNFPPTVTMSTLGIYGQFGNQIYQYAFMRLYSEIHGYRLQTPQWIGQEIFNIKDEPIEIDLPMFFEPENVLYPILPPFYAAGANAKPIHNVDIVGPFCLPSHKYAPFRSRFQEIFKFQDRIDAALAPFVAQLRENSDRPLMALHLRRGDSQHPTPIGATVEWLRQQRSEFGNPIIYIASDALDEVLPAFAEFDPLHGNAMPSPIPEAPYLTDYYVLRHCDLMLAADSTFSFTAAMLNETCRVFRCNASTSIVEAIDQWRDSYSFTY